MKYSKPEDFKGRGNGATNWRKYKWEVSLNGEHVGKYVSIPDINAHLNLGLNCDKVWRLTTGNRVDTKQRNKENSFLSRYGHIGLTKIDEWKEGLTARDTRASQVAEL